MILFEFEGQLYVMQIFSQLLSAGVQEQNLLSFTSTSLEDLEYSMFVLFIQNHWFKDVTLRMIFTNNINILILTLTANLYEIRADFFLFY